MRKDYEEDLIQGVQNRYIRRFVQDSDWCLQEEKNSVSS